MALYHKYRPKTLLEFMGNRTVVDSLQSILSRKSDIPHAMMFTGNSGCGKTTLGRIVANQLGCSEADYKEMDSAICRSIDDVREIRKQMRLKPMSGSVRVWLLDEVHMLGKGGSSAKNEAQNALLKMLEDAPAHVYFILCTTEPQGVLKTIQSRCTQFQVGPLSEKEMARLIKKVLKAEGVEDFPEEAYQFIYQNSLGHVRAALVILDKVIDLPNESIMAAIEQATGEEAEIIDLCRCLIKRESWSRVCKVLKGIEETQEPESVRYAVLGYMNSVLLKESNQQAALCIDCFKNNFYDSGKAGLTEACFGSINL